MKQSTLHAAIIMDGNGRWASRQGLPRIAGHRAGSENLRAIVQAAPDLGIGTLTAYAFSSDNWKRPREEVEALMTLLAWYLEAETPRLVANNVGMRVIGRRDRLPATLVAAIDGAERASRSCSGLHLRLAIDYSARDTILRATQLCVTELYAGAAVTPGRFEELLSRAQHDEGGSPGRPVDVLIRTGGEKRLSDFLLWECAYAELVFTDRMWPEFDAADLRRAIDEFHRRHRRFGGIPLPVHGPIPSTGQPRADRWLR